jgi:hypothetical protein
MAQPKYAARFENFFLNLRLNRAQFADMAAFTLAALQADAKYTALAADLQTELATYRDAHTGQLSGESQGATLTLKQALTDFKAYVKRVERKVIIPNYDDGSPDYKALLPNGRAGLSKSSQTEVEDKFTAFLAAMDARPAVFTAAIRTEGRATILANLKVTLSTADQARKTSDDQRLDLHDGRQATCLVLFRVYATLLLEFAAQPKRVAAFFDFSQADTGGSKKDKSTGPVTPKE